MTRRVGIGTAIAALAIALVLVSALRTASAPDTGKQVASSSGISTSSAHLSADAEAVAQYARRHFPRVFAGAAVDEGARQIIIYRLASHPAFDEAVTDKFPTVRLAFRAAPRTERELQNLTRRVLSDVDYWHRRGIEIAGVGPDPSRGVVEVMTPDAARARPEFRAKYGGHVVVREGAVIDLPFIGS